MSLQEDALELGDGRIDVARHGDVDQQQRPAAAALHHGRELVALDDVVRRRGRGQHDVGALQLRRQRVEADRLAAEALREPDRAVVVAVGDEHRAHAPLGQRARGQLAGLAGADHDHAPAAQVAERLLRELHRDRADRDAAGADAGLGAHALAGGERLAEQAVHERARGALDQRQLVGALDLALDLGLADDHRVEPGGDPEQVARRVHRCAASRDARPARWGGCRPARARMPSAAVSASTSSPTAR